MAVIGQYKCEIQLNPGPNTLSYRIVVEGYHLGSTDSGPNVEQDWQHTYDWNVGAASTPESHILRQTDQDLSASNPILSAADPVDALFFLPDIGANVLEVTLTPYDAINGAQGSGTAGDPQKLYLGTPASASVMRAENAGGDNIVAPLMKGAGGITMTFANSVIEVDGSGAGGVSGLNDLSDVTITTPVINQHLQYDGAAWVNVTDMTIADGFTLTTSGGAAATPSIRIDDSQQTGFYSTNGTSVGLTVQGDRVGNLSRSTFAIYNPNATGTSDYTGGFYARDGSGGNVFSIARPAGTDEEWVIKNYTNSATGHLVLQPGANNAAELQLVRGGAGANLAFSWYNNYTVTPTKVAQLYWDEADGSFQVQASEAASSVALVQNGDKRVEVTSTQTLIRKTDATVAFLVDDAYVETDVTFRPQSVGDLDLGSSSLYWNSIFSETHDWFITTTPVAPASGFGRMWYEGVGVLKVLDSGGTTYTFDATAPTGFTTAGDGLTSSGSTVAVDYLGADSIIAKAPAGSIVSSDEILFMDVDDTSNVKRDLVSSLPFTNNTGDVESVANATNGGLTATNSGGPDVTLALAVDDLLDHSGTLAAADRFAVHESGAGTRKIAASSIGLNSFNNNLTLTAADIADGQFATVSGTYTFAGASVLRLGSNTLQPTLQFWDRDTVGGSYRDVITVPAVEELDIGSAGWAVDILGSSVLVNGAAIGTVTSVSNATNGGITVTNGTTTPTLAVDASNLPNFTASTSMEATDRFVVHEAGQASPTARQIAPADIPLSIFNDNLGFSQNVQGDGISLTTTTGTNDTISVAYAASATNLIGAAQLLVGNAATTDRILVTEGGASAVVRQAQVSQLPFASSTHTHPASDITEGTFGAGAYTFTRTTADTTPTVRIENTSGTTGRVLLTLDGESDELRFENYGTGDWQIVNSQQTNGIRIKNGSGGITFLYNNAEVVAIDSSGGLDTLSGGILTGGTQRIQQDGDLVNIKDITATGAFTTTGVGPHGIGSNGSTNIQLLIDGAFTAIGGASASGIRYNSDITGVSGNTVRLTHFDMSSPTITTQSVNETVDDIASFRIVKPTITNNLFNAGLGEAITSATNGTVTTTGAHGFSTSDIVHINGNTDSNHNGWWTITNTGSNTFTLDEYTGTSSGTGGDAYPASKITKAATLWIPNEPTAGTATGIDEAWGIYAPVSARLGNVTAGLIEPISDSTYALGTAINRWSTVYADSLDVGTFLAGDGAESSPSYAFSDDTNTGMWSPVNDTIAFSTGGTEQFRVTNSTTLSYAQFFVVRPTGQSVMTRFRREDNTDLAWDVRIDTGGTYEIRAVTDAGATVSNGNVFQLEHATGNLTLKGWIRSEDGSNTDPTYSFSSDPNTGMYSDAADVLSFATGGSQRVYINNTAMYTDALVDTTTQIGQTAHSLTALDAASDFAKPSGYRTMASNASLEKPNGNGTAWTSYYHWNVMSRRDSGGGYYGLALGYQSGRMWYGQNSVNTALPNWYEIWTEATPQALPTADGSVSAPFYSFSSDPDTGMYLSSTGTVAFASGGAIKAYVGANEFRVYHKIENADGTAADPAYSFNSDTNTGMYSAAADTIGFSTAGTARWSLNSTGQFVPATSGNYDIGTTSNLVRNIYSNEFRGENGLVSSPSFTFRTDLDTGMYLGSTGILKFSTAGADRLVVSGTTIENYTVGSGYGWQARYVSGTNNPGIFIENSETGNYSRLVQSSSPGNGALYLGVDSANTAILTTTQARFLDGSASAPSITFASDTNTGFYRPAADRFALTAGGSVYLSSELQSTYGYLKITEGAGGTVATLGTTSWSRTWYIGKNLRYNKTAATSSPFDRLNWEYISGDTSSSQMGSLLLSGSNGIASWDFYAVPITTGAGVIPASFTRICRIATNGTDSTGGQIQMTNGVDSAPAYSFSNDPDTGVYLPLDGSIGFTTASTLRATIGSGQFSFGTDWVDNTSTGVDQFQIGNLSGDWGILGRVGSGNSFYITAADSNTTKLSRIKIGTTGNLEDNTANPVLNWSSTALTVYKDIVMSGNETHDIGSTTNRVDNLWASYYYVKRADESPIIEGIRDDASIGSGNTLLALRGRGDLGSGPAYGAQILLSSDETWAQGTDSGGRITFQTTSNNTWNASTERMRIDHDGQVGIGETNPATLLHLSNSAGGNILRLQDTGGAGTAANPYLDFRDSAATRLAYVGMGSTGNSILYINNDTTGAAIYASFASSATSGDFYLYNQGSTDTPTLYFSNVDGIKGYVRADDSGNTWLATQVANAQINIRDAGNSFNIATFDYNGTDTATINSVNNAVLALNTTSATGNPYLRFKQAGTDKARVQYVNGGQMRFRLEGNTDDFTFYAGGNISATDLRLHFNGLGDDLGRWAVENSQFYVEEDQTVLTVAATVTCDWDRSNQLHLTITNTVTIIAIDDDSMQPGGSYILMVQEGTSAPSSVTWDSTDTIFWANGTEPVLNAGDLNDITVVQFFKTTAGSNTRIIGSWFLAQ